MRMLFALLGSLLYCGTTIADDAVIELSKHLGKTPALVVVVCGDDQGNLATVSELIEQTPWTIFCRGTASPGMKKIRNWASERGLLGQRVYVVEDNGPSLWLAGDMADAVWVTPNVDNPPSEKEILRVLHPGGVLIASEKVVVKPTPPGVDEWRHPYHNPDNNVMSQDNVARLPGELRFQTYPVYAAMPNQTLFSSGRIFFFSGHIAFHEREEPMLNKLTVLNAYNGLQLWSRPLNPKHVVHNVVKLATENEVVFAEGETLWVLDAATGQQRGKLSVPEEATAAGDTDWKWIAQEGDKLWAAFGPSDASVAEHRQKRRRGNWPWDLAFKHYKGITDNFGAARRLACYQYPEMKLLWSTKETHPFDARALCIEGGRIFQLAPQQYMLARDTATGKTLWRQTPETSKELFDAIGSAINRQGWGLGWATNCCARASDGVVCIAGPSFKRTIIVSFENGDLLWKTPIESPHPFFHDDVLYVMPRTGKPPVVCQKIDPRTGEVLDKFGLGVIGSCTRLTVTPNQFFYRPGGGQGKTVYSDIGSRKIADYESVVRPGCFDGVVPANGRLYWMPLACDCWQIHGTFSMAPRTTLKELGATEDSPTWAAPESMTPTAQGDWPMFRANASGTATVAASVGQKASELWQRRLPSGDLTAPVSAAGRVFVSGADGIVRALDADSGKTLWQSSSRAAVLHPPAYFNGRVVFGSNDGNLYCLDASNGKLLGSTELAPEKRMINIMNRLTSAWPLGGGVVLNDDGIAYTAAGSTATDGTVVAAVDVATGKVHWRQAYTLDRTKPKLSFGVQANILLKNKTLYINGGAPVGIVALDASSGDNPRVVSGRAVGMEMFLQPDNKPSSGGPELFSHEHARTTVMSGQQTHAYFQTSGQHLVLVEGRLFCSPDLKALENIVELIRKTPKPEGVVDEPRFVTRVPMNDAILWASKTADVRGLAVGTDGVVVLHEKSVEGISIAGQSLWTVPLPETPVRWGVALTKKQCVVTLSNGIVVCLAKGPE